jgi:CBS domain-containing protein
MRDAAEKLSVGGFHALPVVDKKRRLVGIVTSSDLVGQLVARLDS